MPVSEEDGLSFQMVALHLHEPGRLAAGISMLLGRNAMQAQRNTSDSDDDTAEDGERRRQQPTLVVDDWLQMSTDEGRPLQLAVLRARLNYAFAFKVNTSVLCFHVGLNCGDVMHRCAFVIPYLARSHSMASLPHAHAAAGIGPTISESRADDVSIASQALVLR